MEEIILTHFIDAPIEKVTYFFRDLSKFGEVHPLIKKVEKINENEATFFESTKILGFISHNFSYLAKISRDEISGSVIMSAEPKPSVFLELKFDFMEEDDQTKIFEEIKIKASFLVAKILKKEIVKSHRKLVENIRISLLK